MAKRTVPTAAPERPRLTMPVANAAELIDKQIAEGEELLKFANVTNSPDAYIEKNQPWRDYTDELLQKIFTGGAIAREFTGFGFGSWDRDPRRHLRSLVTHTETSLRALKSIRGRLELFDEVASAARATSAPARAEVPATRDVFVVHGRDEATKQTVARFLERLDLQPIILHEQADRGRTLIQKFEDHSSVGFAVVLLTPDDEGSLRESDEPVRPRARQNVILELGYFIGRLGRSHVCALKVDGVEEPSDLHGVLYIPVDAAGAWTLRLARELKAAGIEIDMNRAV